MSIWMRFGSHEMFHDFSSERETLQGRLSPCVAFGGMEETQWNGVCLHESVHGQKTTMFAMPASESRSCSSRDARKEGNGLCAGMCERCWLRFPFAHPYRDDKETDVAHVADTMHGCIVDARSVGDGLTIPAGWMRDRIVRDNMR